MIPLIFNICFVVILIEVLFWNTEKIIGFVREKNKKLIIDYIFFEILEICLILIVIQAIIQNLKQGGLI